LKNLSLKYLVFGPDQVVNDVRAGGVTARVAEPLLADVTTNNRGLMREKKLNYFDD
jgi:hypothetical protein